MKSLSATMENERIIEESDEDRVTVSIDKDGWLAITVYYKVGDQWQPDQDAGVVLRPESAGKLKKFLSALES